MRLAADLFEGYDPGIRPIGEIQEPINVTIMYRLYQIIGLDDTSETLTAINWISMYWIDPLLKWNSSEYADINRIWVPASRVWRPDITIYNGLNEGEQDLRLFDSFNAKIDSTGEVFWSFRAVLRTSCTLRLTEFPWDTQVCNLTMGSWLFDTTYMRVKSDTDSVDLRQFRRNALWDVLRAPIICTTSMYPCCKDPFDEITLYYILRRNGLYYCFNILFPSTLLLGTTLLSFLIPIESGEKISIPVTMFLSQSFLLFAVTQFMPVQSDVIPAIGYILLGIMMLIGLCIICNILVCYVYFKYTGPPPSARLLRLLNLIEDRDLQKQSESMLLNGRQNDESNLDESFIPKSNMDRLTCRTTVQGARRTDTDSIGDGTVSQKSLNTCGMNTKSNTGNRRISSTKWKEVANRLNQGLCIGTLLATIVFAIAVLVIYMENRKHTEQQFMP